MTSITLKDFDDLIGDNRFIKTQHEIAWFKSDKTPIGLGVLIEIDLSYQAVTYKQKDNTSYWVDEFKKFTHKNEAIKFLEQQLDLRPGK